MISPLPRQTLQLETTGGVRFTLPLAGPVSRAMAWLVDVMVVTAMTGLVGMLLSLVTGSSRDLGGALQLLAAFALQILYSIWLEWKWRGQTLGKRMLGLRVMDARGNKLVLSQIVMRNLLRMADLLPLLYAVGGISCLVTRHAQRLGDLAAGTVVTVIQPSELHRIEVLADSHYNSIREQPRLVGRLRQTLTPAQARIVFDAVLRRDRLEPQARIELFSELAQTLKERVAFPPECLIGLSDERLVLGVVESLFSDS